MVFPIVKSVDASIVVPTIVDALVAPIVVPSMAPAPISTVANVEVPVDVMLVAVSVLVPEFQAKAAPAALKLPLPSEICI